MRTSAADSRRFWSLARSGRVSAELRIEGEIGADKTAPDRFAADLEALGKVELIEVVINSLGGDLHAGVKIHSMLDTHSAAVTVHVDGVAASAASIIAMAGDKITIRPGAFIMVHNPTVSGLDKKYHSAADLKQLLGILDVGRLAMVGIYADRTKQKTAAIGAMLDAETWMESKEAVKLGFADCVDGEPISASVQGDRLIVNGVGHDLGVHGYRAVPAGLLRPTAERNAAARDETVRKMAGYMREIRTGVKA